jgi:hypothetical protein
LEGVLNIEGKVRNLVKGKTSLSFSPPAKNEEQSEREILKQVIEQHQVV